jgi:hypothetical protein
MVFWEVLYDSMNLDYTEFNSGKEEFLHCRTGLSLQS